MNQKRSCYEKFLQKYEYGQAINFLNRFDKKFNLGTWKKKEMSQAVEN
jgi:hypothetical protein